MSYTVLARKWRPRTFAEMAGQEHVLRTLINALDSDRLHHGFLFTGTRGVGKTTIARILAKCINCEKGVTSTPCGECSACQEIDAGRFVDLLEVDAASRTKVDDTRELLDNVQYAPTFGRYKVYLIDEVHMLSRHSFNALLKTLEEPPPHVKFLLATTDPQKLPVTVLSRCLQFNLKRLPRDLIIERLQAICKAEDFSYDGEALTLLARGADGSMRDALSLLDQAVAYGDGAVSEADVRKMLGSVERNKVYTLANAVVAGDAKKMLELIAAMSEYAPDFEEVLQEFAILFQRAAIFALTQSAPRDSMEMRDAVKHICAKLSPEEIQLMYQIAILGRRDLPLAPDGRSGFEMVLLRMMAFMPSSAQTPGADSGGSSDAPAAVGKSSRATGRGQQALPATTTGNQRARPARKTSSAVIDTTGSGLDFNDWEGVIKLMGLQGAARQLAANCVVKANDDQHIMLILDEDNRHMLTAQVQSKLAAVMQNHLGDEFTVKIELGKIAAVTPATKQRQAEEARLQSIRDSIFEDPNVKALLETFDAEIQEESIKPIN
ncbi:MAG: DNA polymerase III subunit gamma/tau [Gammaproteobacteria bacterium]|nr:DNA polymerase III subunit gamma/tau [Gammaproteobacteria bacterium]